jgi:hypothetical protein
MKNDKCRRSEQSHTGAKEEGRMMNAEAESKDAQSHAGAKVEGRMMNEEMKNDECRRSEQSHHEVKAESRNAVGGLGKPPQCDINATSKPPQSVLIAN